MRIASFTIKIFLAAAVLSLPLAAHADTFSWSVISAGINGSGTFSTIPSGSVANAEKITSVSGLVNGVAVSLLVPANYDPINSSRLNLADGLYFNYDNLAYTTGPTFDVHGLLFQLTNGIYINLYNNGSTPLVSMLNGNADFDALNQNPVSATMTTTNITAAVPEPSSLLLLGTGLASLTSALRRRQA